MVARKESYKLQRKNYRFEKKKAANELLCSFKDPAVVVLADCLFMVCPKRPLDEEAWRISLF